MNEYRPTRRVMGGLAAAGMSVALLTVPTSVAHAEAGVEFLCAGESTSTYEPGLTHTSQPVLVTQQGAAESCLSGGASDITSGTWELSATGTLSCTGGSASGTRTYTWNTGDVSVEEVSLTVGARPEGQTVLLTEGEIVKGLFTGAKTHSQAVLTNDQLLACHSPEGMNSTSGPRIVQFLR